MQVDERHIRKFIRSYRIALNGCWVRHSKRYSDTYGGTYYGGVRIGAHRFSYELFNGDVPDGHLVMHTCDTPACVNPKHLVAGTQKHNMEDASRKGRMVGPKLNASQAKLIRESCEPGSTLAHRFGVSRQTIHNVRSGRTWSDA